MAHIVDTALAKRQAENDPVRVGLVGAGFMSTGIARQIEKYTPGMVVSVICNRTKQRACQIFADLGFAAEEVTSADQLDTKWRQHSEQRYVASEYNIVVSATVVDVVLEVTGSVEYGAEVALAAIAASKPILVMNAELDGTIGPILKHKASEAGVLFSNTDGDQPGVIMNLYRWVKSIGLKPVMLGNIKGFHNVRRTPETQRSFAEATGQNVRMVTSFCDGTKVSFEMAVVANATRGSTGPSVGMHGFDHDGHVDDAHALFDLSDRVKDDSDGPLVDYIVMARGNKPPGGIFVLGYLEDPTQAHYLKYYKMGEGPIYTFYTPYHLCHFEVALSCARAVLFKDAVCTPLHEPRVEVITRAKTRLAKGTLLDGIGNFHTYGVCEKVKDCYSNNHLPIGLSEGAVLLNDVEEDQLITFADVRLAESATTIHGLWLEQKSLFFPDL